MNDRIEEMENMIEELSSDLAENFMQTIQILSNIVSSNDMYYEGSHSRFVSQKSAQIAQILGMTDTEIMEIKIAGVIHDIGKIGYNESILTKFTAEMTSNEYQKYALHPHLGMKFLSSHQGFKNIGEIIMQHHERIDGSGFPQHLQGKEINPQAAIVALVDTYHNAVYKKQKASTSTTKYPTPIAFLDSSKSRFVSTMNYLHSKSGVLFDKTTVDVLTDIIEAERRGLGEKIIMRLPVHKLKTGMFLAEDIITNYGLIMCYSGEEVTDDIIHSLLKTANWHEIQQKILVMM